MPYKKDEEVVKLFDEKFPTQEEVGIVDYSCEGFADGYNKAKLEMKPYLLQTRHDDLRSIEEDYIEYLLAKTYGREYKGATPFGKWHDKAEARDMNTWD